MGETLTKYLNKVARKVDDALDAKRVSPEFRTGFYYAMAEMDEFSGNHKRKLGGKMRALLKVYYAEPIASGSAGLREGLETILKARRGGSAEESNVCGRGSQLFVRHAMNEAPDGTCEKGRGKEQQP